MKMQSLALFRPLRQLLARLLASQPGEVASAVRTTVAATGITTHPAAGNVLPSLATAHFNFRYLPGARACISPFIFIIGTCLSKPH